MMKMKDFKTQKRKMNELLITELKYECDDFANKLMEMFKGVRVEFSVYDEEEMRKDCE